MEEKSNVDRLREKWEKQMCSGWLYGMDKTFEEILKDFKVVIDDFDFKDYVEMGADIDSAKLRKHLKEEIKQLLDGKSKPNKNTLTKEQQEVSNYYQIH